MACVLFIGSVAGIDPIYTAMGLAVIVLVFGKNFDIQSALLATPIPRGWANKPEDNTGRTLTRAFQDAVAYAATVTITPSLVSREYIKLAQLTGGLTLNVTTTSLADFDEFIFYFETDGTQRIVTLGTMFLASGTITIPANKTASVFCSYDKTLDKLRVHSREITA